MKTEAQQIISTHVSWAVAAGLLPVPLLDFGLVTAVQLDMVHQLCSAYGVSYTQSEAKTRVIAVMGGMTPRLMSSVIKVLPVIGTLGGLVAMPVLSGASTYAVGQTLAKHFEEGGNLENFEISKFTEFYRQMQAKGKDLSQLFADQMRAGRDMATLADIERLHNEGIISNEEYDNIKKRWNDKAKITIVID